MKFKGFSVLLMGATVSMWYLFTSSEAFLAKPYVKSHHYKARAIRDTTAPKIPVLVDTASFTTLEKFEASKSDSFFTSLAEREKFNGTALFAHDGKVLFSQCYGYSNLSTKIPLTDSSEFQLGSVSKQFTAVAIMMLKEKGKLDYDDKVTEYFPDFPYTGVTIRMCLAHRSGLPNYEWTCYAEKKDEVTLIDNMQLMDLLAEYKPEAYFKPNRLYEYCNTNYCVLAAIVEKISGIRFSEFLRENIFTPLGMTHTHIFDKSDTTIPDRVVGYEHNFKKSGSDLLDGIAGDKGIYSTTADLFKWDQALYTDKLLKQSTLREAWQPHSRWMRNKSYGFGWHLLKWDGDTIIYHGGWWHGFNANFIRDVKNKNTIIILSNRVNWCINKSYDLLGMFRKSHLDNTELADESEPQ